MGVYIPGMEMPTDGQMLVIFPDGTTYVCFNGKRERLAQAEVVHVPPHGRLIEANALAIVIAEGLCPTEQNTGFEHPFDILRAIYNAPTVMPAEEET